MTKIGLFGIGLDTYWPQFEGLLENLNTYQEEIKNRIAGFMFQPMPFRQQFCRWHKS